MRTPTVTALALCLAACSRGGPGPGDEQGRGILVVAIDGLRADRLGCAGYDRDTTPFLDGLAKESLRFTAAWAAAPWLLPSHIALLTGCDPLIAKRVLPPEIPPSLLTSWHVPEEAPSLAKELLAQGWTTACFPDSPDLAPVFGIATGFAEFQTIEQGAGPDVVGFEHVGLRLDQWLRNRSQDENWFAYLELNDLVRIWEPKFDSEPHHLPPREAHASVPPVSVNDPAFFALSSSRWSGGPQTIGEYEARYDEMLQKIDAGLRRLFTNLRLKSENTTIVVVGTYGTGFGESGLYLDSGRLADVDLRVPLILRPAKRIAGPEPGEISAPIGLYDLAPTLLALEGYEIPESMQGQSLAPLLLGGSADRDFVVAGCGLQDGWVVMDERFCLECTRPGQCEIPSLVVGWYGDNLDHRDDRRDWLHDRERDRSLGHLGRPADDEGGRQQARLEKLAEGWNQRVRERRMQWQKSSSSAISPGALLPEGEGR